jgi:hypothetical protein
MVIMQVFETLIISIIAFAFASWRLFQGLRTLQVRWGDLTFALDETPLTFWLIIGVQCMAVGLCLGIMFLIFVVFPHDL